MSEKKTELDRLKNCEMFWNADPEISALKSRARSIGAKYNATTEDMPAERIAILQELFGDCPDDAFIKPPFYCDFGFNIHVGKKFFANFACVMLDAAPITIGDNCLIGPECGFYTVNHPIDPVKRAESFCRKVQLYSAEERYFNRYAGAGRSTDGV